MQYRQLNDAWSGALEAAGIERRLTFHGLRHFAATRLAEAGATQRELMAQLGHASPAMTMRYMHSTESHLHGVVEQADSIGAALVAID